MDYICKEGTITDGIPSPLMGAIGLHVLCYVFRGPSPSFVEDLDIQGVSLKVVTWSDFWPAAGENFGDFRSPNPFEMRCFCGTNSRI